MQPLGSAGRNALAAIARSSVPRHRWPDVGLANEASCSYAVQTAPMHAAIYKRRGRRRIVPTFNNIRNFSSTSAHYHKPSDTLADPYKPSFFHSSRPDFLPSSNAASQASVGAHPTQERHDGREAVHVRRHLLPPESELVLPGYDEIPQNYHALLRAVNDENSSATQAREAWQQFVPHFRSSMRGEDSRKPIDVRLFDATFWATTSESPRETGQQLEIFNRARLLYEYATMHNIELTPLQMRRLAYLYVMCWEQHDLRKEPFALQDFATLLLDHAELLDQRHISRLLSRMVTNRMFRVAITMLQRWSTSNGKRRQPRKEQVVFADADSEHDALAESEMARSLFHLDNACLEHTLEAVNRERKLTSKASAIAKQLGLIALQYGSSVLHRQGTARIFMNSYLDRAELCELLPTSLRDLLADETSSIPAYRVAIEEIRTALDQPSSSGLDWRDSLVITSGALLAEKGDLRLAERLLAVDEQHGLPKRWRKDLDELFAECVVITSRKAVHDPDLALAFEQLRLALRFFCRCDWRRVKLDRVVHRILIRAFSRITLCSRDRRPFAPDDVLYGLLRELTTRVLEHDSDLDTLHLDGETGVFHLLRLHMALRDYPYAKRIFLVNRTRQSEVDALPLSGSDFHWLFGAAIDTEHTMTFASQLLRFYIWSDLPHDKLPNLDHKLLIRYVKRLQATKRDEALKSLQENLLGSTMSDVQKRSSGAAVGRLVNVVMAAQTASQDFMAGFVVDIFRLSESSLNSASLARAHCIAMEALAQRRSESTAKTRSILMECFLHFKKRAVRDASAISADARALDAMRGAYLAAINIKLWEAGHKMARQSLQLSAKNGALQDAESLLNELEAVWLEDMESPLHHALRTEVLLLRGRLDDAMELFGEVLQRTRPARIVIDFPATCASKLALALGAADRFEEASNVLGMLHRHRTQSLPLRRKEQQLLEITSLALLCMQDDMADLAVHRAITLMRAGMLPLPSDISIQQRVLQQRQGLPLSYEVQRQIVAQQERLLHDQQSEISPHVDFVSATSSSPKKMPLWSGRITAHGDWDGILQKMRVRLERWLVEGVPLSVWDAATPVPGTANSREHDRSPRSTAAVVKDLSEVAPERPSNAAEAMPKDSIDDTEWNPEEDRRRARAFSTLAAGQHWSASG